MGLNEEHNEQNQQTWLSRVARERQGLSVSVEETLGSSIQEEFRWSEDDDEAGFSAGYPFVQGKSLIPPRLGLQSRVIETVPAESPMSTDLNSSAVVLSDEVDGRKLGATTQNTNILLRFAQRLTASFGALNTNMPPGDTQSTGQLAQTQPMDFGMKASALAAIADIEVCTASTMTGSMARAPQPSIPTTTAPSAAESSQGRQRLAGRTTKIRLEVVHDPDAKKTPVPEVHAEVANEASSRWSRQATESNTTGMRLPIMPTPGYDIIGSTSMHLPAMHARQDTIDVMNTPQQTDQRPMQAALSGTARFERGQREITILNASVTASSVVLVTLTTNPGPVVVQYISLQPQIGFTIHMTAPTTTSASFNYIVLLAELF
jgi:hypothetical protein